MDGYVYILGLANNEYYIGSSNNPSRRLEEHNSGKTKGIRYKLPARLVFCQKFCDLPTARKIEYRLKKLKSHKIIEKIICDKNIDTKLLGV